MHKVVVVIVNWNGWEDTVECLESLFGCEYDHIRVIICDNGSTDNSVNNICAWANGEFGKARTEERTGSLPIPIKHIVYDRAQAESISVADDAPPILIVDIGTNLGFAGGNNVGIKLALAQQDTEYVWLLNNDTQVDRRALSALIDYMERNKNIGICGSLLCDYVERKKIQTIGGTFNRWLGTVRPIGNGLDVDEVRIQMSKPGFSIDYPVGASLLVSRRFFLDVGLMAEDYFLYFEELDWVTRAGKSFDFSVCPDSLVYHKEGASIGTNLDPHCRSLLADFYVLRNRLVFAKKFFPYTLPTVWITLILSAVNRLQRRQWRAAGMALLIALSCGRIKYDPKWSFKS